jgi:hypothetical protein
MADESLKNAYRGIEAEETETARMRARLASRLAAESSAENRWFRPLMFTLPAAAVAIMLVFFWPKPTDLPRLDQPSLAALDLLVEEGTSTVLKEQALVAAEKGEARESLNAVYVLTRLEETPQSLEYAARGLFADPRPEFRIFYLEYMLDHAGTYRYDIDRLENYIDDETDRTCLKLSKKLLPFAGN